MRFKAIFEAPWYLGAFYVFRAYARVICALSEVNGEFIHDVRR